MDLGVDIQQFFKKYQNLMAGVDQIFNKMKNDFPQEVRCDDGCTDCCFALFDLSLVEALYLNEKFNELDDDLKNAILIEADKADRITTKIKKELHKEHKKGAEEQEILSRASREKVRCPLLVDDKCALYEHRPITCRLYGIPMQMDNLSASCALSAFEPGKEYPAVHMHKIHDRLISLSREIAHVINTKYSELHTMLVPVSMCLLTDYNREYLGVREESEQKQDSKEVPTKEWVLGPKE